MRSAGALALASLCCARAPATPAPASTPLVLEYAIPLSAPGDFQPSGLALRHGRLYTVSDKSSASLLEINLGGLSPGKINLGSAGEAPEINLGDGDREKINLGEVEVTPGPAIGLGRENLDLEGIAVDGTGDFLLVSEGEGRLLRVPAAGTKSTWVEIDFVAAARGAGLLATAGAGFEGVAVLRDLIVLAAEREPRGLVVAQGGRVWAWRMERSVLRLPPGRRPDFADLAVDGGRLYALVRNADAIVELVPDGDRFEEGRSWSFAQAVAANPYEDARYGMAEGLAIDAAHVYVVLDNNGSPRLGAAHDRRPMLFVFSKPDMGGS